MQDTYFISDVAKTTGATSRQIREWTKHGYLGRVTEVNWGKNKAVIYNKEHVDKVAMIVKFKEDGYTLQSAIILMQDHFEKKQLEQELKSSAGK